MGQIYFLDCTNRDGVQASRISLSKFQKTMVNVYLGESGVHQSEFGFPYIKHEQDYIKANLELKERGALGSLVLGGWCRLLVIDIAASLSIGVKDLNISISTSDQMIQHKFEGKITREGIIKLMTEAVKYARQRGISTLGVNAEDASRADLSYLVEFGQAAKEAGADRLRYCDTVGYDNPTSIYDRARALAERVKIDIEVHCHNDLGMAVANSIAGARGAIDGGVNAYVNTTVNGLGERCGQADLLSCILACKFARDMENYTIADPVNLKTVAKLARYVAYAFNVPIHLNQPGVGANSFAHESGIHADGAIKDRKNYELYDPEVLGIGAEERIVTGHVITTGEYGGMAGLRYVYGKLGITLPDTESAERILDLVRYASAHNQLPLTEDELRFIAKYPEQVRKILTIIP